MENSDWIALGAFMTGIAALGTAAWEGVQNRKHNKLSLKPLLVFNYEEIANNDDDEIKLTLTNCGAGVAVFTAVQVLLDAVILEGNDAIADALFTLETVRTYQEPDDFKVFSATKGYALKNGSSINLFTIRNVKNTRANQITADIKRRVIISVKFKSMYEEEDQVIFSLLD